MRRRRLLVVGWAVALLTVSLASCASEGDGPRADGTTTTAPPAATASTMTPAACALGGVPDGGEVTFVREGQLLGASADGRSVRCLADRVDAQFQWNGSGDRVVFERGVVLSRPTGKSVLRVDGGRLFKRPTDGDAWTDISFLDETESAVYHPRGEHIVAVGRRDDVYGIYVATNLGERPQLVTRGESATSIGELTWTASGALVFTADHGYSDTHLHRLEFPSLRLTTVDAVSAGIRSVAASRFEGAGLAWTESGGDGRCSLRINRGGKVVEPPASVASSTPVGWLPGGVLVVRDGCGPLPSEVRTVDLSGSSPVVHEVADGALGIAVRAALPVGEGLDLDEVVESQAPA